MKITVSFICLALAMVILPTSSLHLTKHLSFQTYVNFLREAHSDIKVMAASLQDSIKAALASLDSQTTLA